LLLRSVSPFLRDTGRNGLRRLLALAHGLNTSGRLSGAGRKCHG
jgi:hypothetical protein